MHVLTLHMSESRIEIHMLNPREMFPRFGGSRSGLLVGKTASMITRQIQHGWSDTERDIHDPFVWDLLARAINGQVEGIKAEVPAKTG